MKIIFLYPAVRNVPNGGLKVIYDYANRLVNDGYCVNLIYASYFSDNDKGFLGTVKCLLKYFYQLLWRKPRGCSWYKLNPSIKEYFVWAYNKETVPVGDIIIATAVTTATYASSLYGFTKRLYLIQDFENFIAKSESYIFDSFRLPLTKIVVSSWLKNVVDKYSDTPCIFVPNGFNHKKYYITIPITQKTKHVVSLLYHTRPAKGLPIAFKALEIAKMRIPELEVNMFGVYEPPKKLPSWIHYIKNPTEEQHLKINNQSSIYLGCSCVEGWGLTIGEAMMCGQAVVCTNNKGYLEMAKDGYNALVASVGDAQALANNIVRLVNDDELRYSIAKKGLESIKEFNLEESYQKFKYVLEQ